MPRQIPSQDPITRPATSEKLFDDVKMTALRVTSLGRTTQLKAVMQPYDYETDEVHAGGVPYIISIKSLEAQMVQSPKFAAAWDTITDAMGLAYDFFRLKDKVQAALANGDDAMALIAARDAALAALRSPIT